MFLVEKAGLFAELNSLLQPVWEDGEFIKRQTFSDVRKILKEQE